MSKLFGTDGVRGRAGVSPLDPPTIRRLGAALVRALSTPSRAARLIIGRDTRESGVWIERELAWGAAAAGAEVISGGILPTPAVAFLARAHYDAGVVISASHNPFEDNGIKVFSGAGEKLTQALEARVEAIVADASWQAPDGDPPATREAPCLDEYVEHVLASAPARDAIRRMRIALDCANGAVTTAAPRVFGRLGVKAVVIGDAPNGRNINLGCGSTHPESLARVIVDQGLDVGAAFDGDGDRAIFVDHQGRIVNGDAVLLMCARHLKAQGRLAGDAVVATVMSNMGLESALRESGIETVRCPVGDKYVMEEMLKRNISLGGEQSGHIIFADSLFTGDGIVTALNVLRVIVETGRSLAEWADDLVTYPQVLLNVRVRERVGLQEIPGVQDVIARVENQLGADGRLLVRYSGTEPLLRIMLEGRNEDDIRRWAEEIGSAVRARLS